MNRIYLRLPLGMLLLATVSCASLNGSSTRSPSSFEGHGASDEDTFLKVHNDIGERLGFEKSFFVPAVAKKTEMTPLNPSKDYFSKLDEYLGPIEVSYTIRYNGKEIVKAGKVGWEAFAEFNWGRIEKLPDSKEARRSVSSEGNVWSSKLKVGSMDAELLDVYKVLQGWKVSKRLPVDSDDEPENVSVGRASPQLIYKNKITDGGAPFKVTYQTTPMGIDVITRR